MSEVERTNCELHVEMPDGSIWSVPAHLVADDRARYYAAKGEDYAETYAETVASEEEMIDWAENNMNWSDVSTHARRVGDPAPVSMEDGWMNGPKFLVPPEASHD